MTDDKQINESGKQASEGRLIRILACFAILWNIIGLITFLLSLTATEASLEAQAYSFNEIDYILSTPLWAKLAGGVALVTGLAGSAYLFFQRKRAYYVFAISLLAILVVMLDALTRGAFEVLGVASNGLSTAIVIIGIFLFWFTNSLNIKGQLR